MPFGAGNRPASLKRVTLNLIFENEIFENDSAAVRANKQTCKNPNRVTLGAARNPGNLDRSLPACHAA